MKSATNVFLWAIFCIISCESAFALNRQSSSSVSSSENVICPVASYEDLFDDGILGTEWIVGNSGVCGLASEVSGYLLMKRPNNCTDRQSATIDGGARPLVGDFEMTIDFDLTSFSVPPSGDRLTGIQVKRVSNGSFVATIERYNRVLGACNPSTQNYKAWTTVSSNCNVAVSWSPTSDNVGSFRISRVGTLMTLYYWQGAWIALNSNNVTSDDVFVHIFTSGVNGDNGAYEVRYDNLKICDEFVDTDNDGVHDGIDNCLNTPNPLQEDIDGNGIGDACDCCDTPGDYDNDGSFNIADVTAGIARIFSGGAAPSCQDGADANGDNAFNVADVTYGIARIFSGGPAPVCGITGG